MAKKESKIKESDYNFLGIVSKEDTNSKQGPDNIKIEYLTDSDSEDIKAVEGMVTKNYEEPFVEIEGNLKHEVGTYNIFENDTDKKEEEAKGNVVGTMYGSLIKLPKRKGSKGEASYTFAIGYLTADREHPYKKEHMKRILEKTEQKLIPKLGDSLESITIKADNNEREILEQLGFDKVDEEYKQPSISLKEDGTPKYEPTGGLTVMVKYLGPFANAKKEEKHEHLTSAIDRIVHHWYPQEGHGSTVKDFEKRVKNYTPA